MPCSTTRPSSITRIASAARMVDSRWAMTRAVRPGQGGRQRRLHGGLRLESRWAVASSRMTTRGRASSSRAMVSRWRSPPDSR